MVCASPIKLGVVAGRGGRVHGGSALQWVCMEVTVIGRLTLKLHTIVCTASVLLHVELSTCS